MRPRLFNVLPVNIWNLSGCTVETFKLHLDRFLATVHDEPQVRGYTTMRRAESNSLLHMSQLAGPQRVKLEETENVAVSRGSHPWSPWD